MLPKEGLGEEPSLPSRDGKNFQGQTVRDLFVLELFAGTARLTQCFGRHGFKAMAFDNTSKRSEGQSILEFDLSNRDGIDSLLSFIESNAARIALIHLAPPCGTASRARTKKLKWLKVHNLKEPKPLRDDKFPNGFPWLKGSDKKRTEIANILYENCVYVIHAAIRLDIAFTLENPCNSLMWQTDSFVNLSQSFPFLKFVTFHNCAHGGARDKLTSFLTNKHWFDSLELRCDKQHSHAPWTPQVVDGKIIFPTHSEAAYPKILCERIVTLVLNKVLELGATTADTLGQRVPTQHKTLNRVVLGALPRGKHVKPLVSEFGTYVNVVLPPQCDDELQSLMTLCPKGTTVQSRLLLTWGEVRDAMEKQKKKFELSNKLAELKVQQGHMHHTGSGNLEPSFFSKLGCENQTNYKILLDLDRVPESKCERVVIAIPREPQDFLCRAVEAGHPRSVAVDLPSELKKIVEWNRDATTFEIHRCRIDFVKFWTAKAKEVAISGGELLGKAPKHLHRILKGKRLALWQAMIDHYDYPDKQLVTDIVNGFPITGWLADSQVFPKDFRPPSLDCQALMGLSRGMNEHVKSRVLAASDGELCTATWEETNKELSETWMEVDSAEGCGAAWAMRFGLQQKDKVRVIDDFTLAGINQTVGLHERLKIFGIDDIAALLAHSLDSCVQDVHPCMMGKTMDLKSAYKQFGICKADRERVRVATVDPDTRKLVLLMVNALPFGATGSVAAFLRISIFLWYIGVVGPRLCWTAFYDDFTLLSRVDCCNNAAWCAECLFDLLGVVFARDGKKATVFEQRFSALGVVFDLSQLANFTVLVGHTESRTLELKETIQSILKEDRFSQKSIERLRGRMLWFENFVCGRQANTLVAKLGKFAGQDKSPKPLDASLKDTLLMLLARLSSGRPVGVSPKVLGTWICFTDGACEERCSVGGVLVDPHGRPVQAFGSVVPESFQTHFYEHSKHPIYEIELLPLLAAAVLWGPMLDKSQVVFYLDNEAARAGLIKGSGATRMADAIISEFCEMESSLQLKTWFSRVPSHSNLSDGPSRLDFSLTDSLGYGQIDVPWIAIQSMVLARLS